MNLGDSLLPSDGRSTFNCWRETTLGELCDGELGEIQTGPFGSQLHASDYKPSGIPVVNPTHLRTNTIDETHLPRIDQADADRLSRHYLREGDILISRRGDFSRYSYIGPRQSGWLCGTGCLVIRMNHPEVDNRFLSYLMSFDIVQDYLRQAAVGSIMPNLNTRILSEMRLSFPPFEEQRAIVRLLDAIRSAMNMRLCELALERERKSALMEYFFIHGTRGESTKQTDVGEIPESWHVTQLAKVARIGNGSTPKRSDARYWKGGTIPWITSTQVHDVVIEHANEFVTETARKECHLPLVPNGSIVIAITGQGKTLGNAAILAIDTCINQHLAYLRLESASIHPPFVLVYLHSKYSYLRGVALAGGSTKGALTCGFLKSMSIPVPPLDEQIAISDLLLGCDRKCKCLEREMGLLEELFRALLEELMAGQLSATLLIEEHLPR